MLFFSSQVWRTPSTSWTLWTWTPPTTTTLSCNTTGWQGYHSLFRYTPTNFPPSFLKLPFTKELYGTLLGSYFYLCFSKVYGLDCPIPYTMPVSCGRMWLRCFVQKAPKEPQYKKLKQNLCNVFKKLFTGKIKWEEWENSINTIILIWTSLPC